MVWLKNVPKFWKPILVALLAVLVMVVGYFGVSYLNEQSTLVLSGMVQAKEIKNGSRFGGRVEEVLVEEGEKVEAGDVMVVFDNSDLQAQLDEAKAALDQAKAKHSLLKSGADVSDLRQAQARVNQAQEKLRILSSGARPEEVAQVQAEVAKAEGMLKTAKNAYESGQTMLQEGIISQNKYQELETQYSTAQSALKAAKASLTIATTGARPEEIRIARSELAAARAMYDKLKSGAKAGELDIANSTISQAKSVVDAIQDKLEEMKVRAPIDGVVSVLTVTPKELIPPGRPVVSVINYDSLWTDVFVPESKLDFVKVGKPVDIRANVYGDDVFQGRVAFINPKSEFVPSGGGRGNTNEESMFRVKISMDRQGLSKENELYPGMKVDVILRKE